MQKVWNLLSPSFFLCLSLIRYRASSVWLQSSCLLCHSHCCVWVLLTSFIWNNTLRTSGCFCLSVFSLQHHFYFYLMLNKMVEGILLNALLNTELSLKLLYVVSLCWERVFVEVVINVTCQELQPCLHLQDKSFTLRPLGNAILLHPLWTEATPNASDSLTQSTIEDSQG